TPNRREALILTGNATASDELLVSLLRKRTGGNVLLTLGSEGMLLLPTTGKGGLLPTLAREVADVSGAGDTVTALVGLTLAANGSVHDAADLGNRAAGIVVGRQ